MNKIAYSIIIGALMLILSDVASAANKTVTFFSDGAILKIEVSATQGIVEARLPSQMIENSLRVKPLKGAEIRRVELKPSKENPRARRELDALLERRNKLEDRLQSLSAREDIFKAAAKSQSGRAPRKTKTNPDPAQSIRQGTDFAIAKLEAVYAERDKAIREMRRIDVRADEIRKNDITGGTTALVSVTPKNGHVSISFAINGITWKPYYDLRLANEEEAALVLYTRLDDKFMDYERRVSLGSMGDGRVSELFTVRADSLTKLMDFTLPIADARLGNDFVTSFSALMTNTSAFDLPSGDASLYHNGEYLGRVRFNGVSSGESVKISTN